MALAPPFNGSHPEFVGVLIVISTIAYVLEVRVKLVPESATYFDASVALAVVALAVSGPFAALVVWIVPDFLARYVMRPVSGPVPQYRLSPGLVATWASFALAVLAGWGIVGLASPASPAAAAPALFSAGVAMAVVNFTFARLLFAPFYQRVRPMLLLRSELFAFMPLVIILVALAVATWLLIAPLGVFALALLAAVVIGPQLAFAELSRRRSVANMSRLDAEKLYAGAIADMLGMSRADRRVLECAAEFAAGRSARWSIEEATCYSLADVAEAIPVALHVDERWDGEGNPARLEGHQAPLGSRILAVAREWSELTAHGTPGLPHAEAMLGLGALSGSELDPRVVHAAQQVVAQEEIFIGAPDFEPRLHRLPLPRSARHGAVPALLGKMAAAH